jgi:hypothetical protein
MTALDASSVAALLKEFGQRSALRGGNSGPRLMPARRTIFSR